MTGEPNPEVARETEPTGSGNHSIRDEVDLGLLAREIWRCRWLVFASATVATLLAWAFVTFLPDTYRAEALIASAQSDGRALSGLVGQFGGLASLAGVNLKDKGIAKIEIAVETLKSRKFLTKVIRDHEILVPLFAGERWDSKLEKLILDEKIYNEKTKTWVRKVNGNKSAKPSDQEAFKRFKAIFSVRETNKSGFYKVYIDYISPVMAKNWVDWILNDLNETMRSQDIKESKANIQFLQTQLRKTDVSNIQNVFFTLIEKNLQKVMLANSKKEYVFRTIDPAIQAEYKHAPNRLLIVLLGFLAGMMISLIFVVSRYSIVNR